MSLLGKSCPLIKSENQKAHHILLGKGMACCMGRQQTHVKADVEIPLKNVRMLLCFGSYLSCLDVLSWSPDIFYRGNGGIGFVGDRRWTGTRRSGGRENSDWDILSESRTYFQLKGRNKKKERKERWKEGGKKCVWILLKQKKLHHLCFLWNVYSNFQGIFYFLNLFMS